MKNTIVFRIMPLLFGLLVFSACQPKRDAPDTQSDADATLPNEKYDWTGTYAFDDEGTATVYALRLHKRSVDGSYEMQYSRSAAGQVSNYTEYMFDAKDADSSIMIRFMGSFTADENTWPFKKGDTMCILKIRADSSVETTWKALQPKNVQGSFRQVSKDYH